VTRKKREPTITWSLAKGAKPVRFGGFAVWSPYRATIDDPALPYFVEIVARVEQGRFVCEELVCRRRPGGPAVNAVDLRRLPIAGFIRHTAPFAAWKGKETPTKGVYSGVPLNEEDIERFYSSYRRTERRGGRQPTTDERLREVADIYRAALSTGRPSKTVAQVLHIDPAHARRLVGMARKRGFLKPTRPGKAGEGGTK
jgi:hypothetical protein